MQKQVLIHCVVVGEVQPRKFHVVDHSSSEDMESCGLVADRAAVSDNGSVCCGEVSASNLIHINEAVM